MAQHSSTTELTSIGTRRGSAQSGVGITPSHGQVLGLSAARVFGGVLAAATLLTLFGGSASQPGISSRSGAAELGYDPLTYGELGPTAPITIERPYVAPVMAPFPLFLIVASQEDADQILADPWAHEWLDAATGRSWQFVVVPWDQELPLEIVSVGIVHDLRAIGAAKVAGGS